METTLSIIKPDAVKRDLIPAIYLRFQQAKLSIVAAKMLQLSLDQAQKFYQIHQDKPFFAELCRLISGGTVMVQVLAGDNAVQCHRQLMGATNPKDALPGTLRADFAISLSENSVHGSDSLENAKQEIAFFFQPHELCLKS